MVVVGLRRTVPAGLVDAGFSSLGTLAAGLYAAKRLEPAPLGAYAVFFTAFLLIAVVPAQLMFIPAEIVSLRYLGAARLRQLPNSLRLGASVAVPAALSGVLAALVVPSSIPRSTVAALTITTVMCSFVSPIQDHVRRMFHIGGQSWKAAGVSGVQFAAIVAAIGTLAAMHVPTPWIPLGGLAVANATSILAGLAMVRHLPPDPVARLHFRDLVRSGQWLLVVGAAPSAAAFAASALVAHLASPATLGYAEAARVVAQPLLVLALGLSAVLGPRSMEAAALCRSEDATRIRRIFIGLGTAGSALYVAAVGFRWPGNLLAALLPNAYVVGGLVAVTSLGNYLSLIVFPRRSELMGGSRERPLANAEVAASLVLVAMGGTAGVTQSYAKPVGYVAQGIARMVTFRRAARGLYEEGDSNAPEEVPAAIPQGPDAALS